VEAKMKKIYSTEHAPAAIGPYSQAVDTGDLVFLAGQTPIDPATGKLVEGDVSVQAHRALTNIKAVLAAAGLEMHAVVKATVFLTTMDDFQAVNKVYGEFFPTDPPARSAVAVSGLPMGCDVEIEVIARR
jgi:2-iminobutanoate/2-iminopropanoate deaminase